MRILGLTGSIGMGKSTVAAMFRAAGIPVFDADAAVHDLYRADAAATVEAAFPGVTGKDGVDRGKLGKVVLGDKAALARLEAIIHPMVEQRRLAFLERARVSGARAAVLDVPLLFEAGRDVDCDAIAVVSAPFDVQKARVLAREGMTEERFAAILSRQMPDAEKRQLAHYVIENGGDLENTRRQVAGLIQALAR